MICLLRGLSRTKAREHPVSHFLSNYYSSRKKYSTDNLTTTTPKPPKNSLSFVGIYVIQAEEVPLSPYPTSFNDGSLEQLFKFRKPPPILSSSLLSNPSQLHDFFLNLQQKHNQNSQNNTTTPTNNKISNSKPSTPSNSDPFLYLIPIDDPTNPPNKNSDDKNNSNGSNDSNNQTNNPILPSIFTGYDNNNQLASLSSFQSYRLDDVLSNKLYESDPGRYQHQHHNKRNTTMQNNNLSPLTKMERELFSMVQNREGIDTTGSSSSSDNSSVYHDSREIINFIDSNQLRVDIQNPNYGASLLQ